MSDFQRQPWHPLPGQQRRAPGINHPTPNPAHGRGGPGDMNYATRITRKEVTVEVRTLTRRIEEPIRPREQYYIPYHDPAFGPSFRCDDTTKDVLDHELLSVPAYESPPLQQLVDWRNSEEQQLRRELWWMHTFEEMRHPFPARRANTSLAPATVCVDPVEHCGLTWLLAG
uniref:Uncharacterized protein n=1 Tax=Alexandrium catenella TaxID=2925 RepID=A0A7S1RN04_ALECA